MSDYLSAPKGTTIDPIRALGYRVSLKHRPRFVDNGATAGSMSPTPEPAKFRVADDPLSVGAPIRLETTSTAINPSNAGY